MREVKLSTQKSVILTKKTKKIQYAQTHQIQDIHASNHYSKSAEIKDIHTNRASINCATRFVVNKQTAAQKKEGSLDTQREQPWDQVYFYCCSVSLTHILFIFICV